MARPSTSTVVGPTTARPPTDQVAAFLFEAFGGHAVVPRIGGFTADPSGHGGPVGGHDGGTRQARDAPALGQHVGGAHHHLRGDAAPIRALAADQLGFDPDHLEPSFGQVLGDLLTTGSEADDDRIDLHGIYRPPQLVTWTGATIGVPTSS